MSINESKKVVGSKAGLTTIRCSCGFEILLVPDVKVMSEAIEAHAEKHQKKAKDVKASKADAELITDHLIAQVFKKASKA